MTNNFSKCEKMWERFIRSVLTFVKLRVLWKPRCSEPGAGLFGFDLYRGDGEEQWRHRVIILNTQADFNNELM